MPLFVFSSFPFGHFFPIFLFPFLFLELPRRGAFLYDDPGGGDSSPSGTGHLVGRSRVRTIPLRYSGDCLRTLLSPLSSLPPAD